MAGRTRLFLRMIGLGAALAALTPGVALAAGPSATTVGAVTVTIVTPISLQHWAGYVLNFGKFTAGTGGTVTITAPPTGNNGTATTTGGVAFVSGSTTSDDAFLVTGQPNTTINISTTGGTVTSGANSMSFTTTPMLASGQIVAAGNSATAFFTVGGTLTVSGTQAAGSYTGSYNCTVAYQ